LFLFSLAKAADRLVANEHRPVNEFIGSSTGTYQLERSRSELVSLSEAKWRESSIDGNERENGRGCLIWMHAFYARAACRHA
jgi:hypothetical protein